MRSVGSAIKDGFELALPIFDVIATSLDVVAKILFGVSGGTLAAAAAFLQFTGVAALLGTAFSLFVAIGKLFINIFKVALIPIIKEFIVLLGVGLVNALGLVRIAAIKTLAAIVAPIALLSLGFFGLGAAIAIFIAQLFGIKITAADVIKSIKNIPSEIIKVFTTLGSIIIGAVALI